MSKSDEQIERESNKRIARENAKALPAYFGKRSGAADWAGADAGRVMELVCAVAVQGGAVRFGYTRDGGAYSIGIYMGELSKTYYCNEKDGIDETIRELNEYFAK